MDRPARGTRPAESVRIILALPLLLNAADLSVYRGFQFGASVEACAKAGGAAAGSATVMHSRPARIVQLEWNPNGGLTPFANRPDPVRDSILRFYNGELFQVVTTYDWVKVEGMSPDDMANAMSRTYGTFTKPRQEVPFHSNYGESTPVIARWQNENYVYDLVRTGDQTSYALIASSKRLEGLARAAIAESIRLDALDAPRRAIELQANKDAENKSVLDKARAINNANFRP